MRWLGAALLILAGVSMGLQTAAELRETAKRRESLCRMLERMAYELGRFRRPLPELFSGLRAGSAGLAQQLCVTVSRELSESEKIPFSQVWSRAVEPLPPPERECLAPLGTVLGCYGTEEQLLAIERCRKEMERYLQKARDDQRERSRTGLGLWTAAGFMAAVLLI